MPSIDAQPAANKLDNNNLSNQQVLKPNFAKILPKIVKFFNFIERKSLQLLDESDEHAEDGDETLKLDIYGKFQVFWIKKRRIASFRKRTHPRAATSSSSGASLAPRTTSRSSTLASTTRSARPTSWRVRRARFQIIRCSEKVRDRGELARRFSWRRAQMGGDLDRHRVRLRRDEGEDRARQRVQGAR